MSRGIRPWTAHVLRDGRIAVHLEAGIGVGGRAWAEHDALSLEDVQVVQIESVRAVDRIAGWSSALMPSHLALGRAASRLRR